MPMLGNILNITRGAENISGIETRPQKSLTMPENKAFNLTKNNLNISLTGRN